MRRMHSRVCEDYRVAAGKHLSYVLIHVAEDHAEDKRDDKRNYLHHLCLAEARLTVKAEQRVKQCAQRIRNAQADKYQQHTAVHRIFNIGHFKLSAGAEQHQADDKHLAG